LDCCVIVATIHIKQVRQPSYFLNAGWDTPEHKCVLLRKGCLIIISTSVTRPGTSKAQTGIFTMLVKRKLYLSQIELTGGAGYEEGSSCHLGCNYRTTPMNLVSGTDAYNRGSC
jgi:hypothetical protein